MSGPNKLYMVIGLCNRDKRQLVIIVPTIQYDSIFFPDPKTNIHVIETQIPNLQQVLPSGIYQANQNYKWNLPSHFLPTIQVFETSIQYLILLILEQV